MTTDKTPEHGGADDCPPPSGHDPECDPQLIAKLRCQAVGVAEKAKYNSTYQADLEAAQTAFETTRTGYRTKRHDANMQIGDLRHQIKHLVERIKCQIEQPRVWRCLDAAYNELQEELKDCKATEGCCQERCEFEVGDAARDLDALDTQTVRDHAAGLRKQIAEAQRHADEAKACFNKLVGEPAALEKRVADAKAAIDAITAALGGDQAKTNLKMVYAQALVARHAVKVIWGGFEQTQEFVDCLCRALMCWTKGCDAVSVLTGAAAVAECRLAAREAQCEKLRTQPVDEILARYDKLCGKPDTCDDTESGPDRPKHGNRCEDSGSESPSSSGCKECDDLHRRHHGHPHGCRCGCGA